MNSRRGFLWNVLFGDGAMTSATILPAEEKEKMDISHGMQGMNMKKPEHAPDTPVLVEAPDVQQLLWRMNGNIKEFHLVAESVKQEILPDKIIDPGCYAGSAQGPTP